MRKTVLHLAAPMSVGLLYSLWSARPLWSDVALLGVLAFAVRLTWRGWAVAAPRPLRLPALAFGAAYALAAACGADPAGWRSVLGLVAYALVFMLAGNLLALGVTRGQLYRALVLAAAPLLIGLLAVWVAEGAQFIGYRARYENANTYALANLLIFPALLAGELRGLLWTVSLAVAWLTGGRGGALGLVAGLASLGPTTLRRQWAAALGLVAVAGLGLVPRLVHLPADLSPAVDFFSPNARDELWRLAGEMWLASPWVGHGPGSYKAWWLADAVKVARGYVDFGHPHNLALHLASETGVIGLAAGAWLVVAGVRALSGAGSKSVWASAALAATVALMAHSLADTPTTAPYLTVAWLALVRMGLHEPA